MELSPLVIGDIEVNESLRSSLYTIGDYYIRNSTEEKSFSGKHSDDSILVLCDSNI